MHLSLSALLGLAALSAQVQGHGQVTKPKARLPGDATAAVCGKTLVKFYQADETSYPEALMRANPKGLDSAYDAKKCNLYFCKGFQFDDNKDHVLQYTPGQTVDLEVYIRIPHKGYANVSVVDLASNSVIGAPLKTWADNYAATMSPPKDQTSFSVKIPELAGKCTKPNECVSWVVSLHRAQRYNKLTTSLGPAVVLVWARADV